MCFVVGVCTVRLLSRVHLVRLGGDVKIRPLLAPSRMPPARCTSTAVVAEVAVCALSGVLLRVGLSRRHITPQNKC